MRGYDLVKEIVLGVDLGMRTLISTSTYRGFGDMMLRNAIGDADQPRSWIADQIERMCAQLLLHAKEMESNVIAIEDLKVCRLTVGEREKSALSALINTIRNLSVQNEIRIELVDPRDTSGICSACGRPAPEYRLGGEFCCPYCGYCEDSDVNAAKNIGIRYIIRSSIRDLKEGREPWHSYFLSTSSGSKSIDELNWVHKAILLGLS